MEICSCINCALLYADRAEEPYNTWFERHYPIISDVRESTGIESTEDIVEIIEKTDEYYQMIDQWNADREVARVRLENNRRLRAVINIIAPIDDNDIDEREYDEALQNSTNESYKKYTSSPEQVNEFLIKRKSAMRTNEYVCSICYENMTEYAYTLPCADAIAGATVGNTGGMCKAIFCEDCFRTYLLTPRTKEHYDCPYKCKNTFTLDTPPEHPEHSAHSAHSAHSVHSEHPVHPEHPVHSAQQEDEVKPDSGLASAANS